MEIFFIFKCRVDIKEDINHFELDKVAQGNVGKHDIAKQTEQKKTFEKTFFSPADFADWFHYSCATVLQKP